MCIDHRDTQFIVRFVKVKWVFGFRLAFCDKRNPYWLRYRNCVINSASRLQMPLSRAASLSHLFSFWLAFLTALLHGKYFPLLFAFLCVAISSSISTTHTLSSQVISSYSVCRCNAVGQRLMLMLLCDILHSYGGCVLKIPHLNQLMSWSLSPSGAVTSISATTDSDFMSSRSKEDVVWVILCSVVWRIFCKWSFSWIGWRILHPKFIIASPVSHSAGEAVRSRNYSKSHLTVVSVRR